LVSLQAEEFVQTMEGHLSFYGLQKETLNSLLLTYLPSVKCKYVPRAISTTDTKCKDTQVFLLKFLLEALKQNAKFSIPEVIAVWVRSKTRQCSSLLLMVLCGLLSNAIKLHFSRVFVVQSRHTEIVANNFV